MPRPREWLSWSELLRLRRIYRIIRDKPPRCRCGNEDPNCFLFSYDPRQGRIRIRCTICGRQQSLSEKHAWYASEIDLMSHGEE